MDVLPEVLLFAFATSYKHRQAGQHGGPSLPERRLVSQDSFSERAKPLTQVRRTAAQACCRMH